MTSMAKIFVVVNLVLTLAFFGSAAALLGAQDDYKTAFEGVTQKFEEAKKEWQAKLDQANRERDQAVANASKELASRTAADTRSKELESQLTASNQTNQKLTSTTETNATELASLRKLIEENRATNDALRQRAEEASQNYLNANKKLEDEIANRVGLEQQVSQLNEQIASLSAKIGDLDKSKADLEFWLGAYKEKFGEIGMPGKGANGVVLAVKGNLVSISVGSEDGVKIGDEYHLRRGDKYVGRITIKTVMKNQAVGQFDEEFAGSGAPAQVNDVAYTR